MTDRGHLKVALLVIAALAQGSAQVALRDDGYFQLDGKFYVPIGLNYWPARTGVHMWQQFNSTEVDHDFAVLASVGFNAVRIFAVWDDFEPSLGSYNSTSFDNLEETLQLAKNHQLKVDMSVFVGWMSGFAFWPSWKAGNLYSNETNINASVAFAYRVAQTCQKYKDTMLAMEFGNEMGVVDMTDTFAIVGWTNKIYAAFKQAAPDLLVVPGTSHSTVMDDRHWPLGGATGTIAHDFLDIHSYPILFDNLPSDGFLDPFTAHVLPWETSFVNAFGPVMAQEWGTLVTGGVTQQDTFLRNVLPRGWAAGANGFLYWCMRDIFAEDQVPYNIQGKETLLGLIDQQDNVKPGVRAFAEFAANLSSLTEPPKAAAHVTGIYIPVHYYFDDDEHNPGNHPKSLSPLMAVTWHFLTRNDVPASATKDVTQSVAKMVRLGSSGGLTAAADPLVMVNTLLDDDEAIDLSNWVAEGHTLVIHGLSPTLSTMHLLNMSGISMGSSSQNATSVRFHGQSWNLTSFMGGKIVETVATTAKPVLVSEHNPELVIGWCNSFGQGHVVTLLAIPEAEAYKHLGSIEEREVWAPWFDNLTLGCGSVQPIVHSHVSSKVQERQVFIEDSPNISDSILYTTAAVFANSNGPANKAVDVLHGLGLTASTFQDSVPANVDLVVVPSQESVPYSGLAAMRAWAGQHPDGCILWHDLSSNAFSRIFHQLSGVVEVDVRAPTPSRFTVNNTHWSFSHFVKTAHFEVEAVTATVLAHDQRGIPMLTAYQPADAANFMFTSASVEAEDKAQVTAWTASPVGIQTSVSLVEMGGFHRLSLCLGWMGFVTGRDPIAMIYNLSSPILSTLKAELEGHGFQTMLTSSESINAGSLQDLTAQDFFVVPNATELSPSIHSAYQKYAVNGGNLILLGGPLPTMAVEAKVFSLNVMLSQEVYQMDNIVSIISPATGELVYATSLPWKGVSALAFEPEGAAIFDPLLQGLDHYNRAQGWIFSRTKHNNSLFGQASWLLCGVLTPSFYLNTDFFSNWLFPAMTSSRPRTALSPTHSLNHRQKQPRATSSTSMALITTVDGHLSYENGTRYFMVGSNFYRPFRNEFNPAAITANFARAGSLGLNTMRLFSFEGYLTDPSSGPDNVALIRSLAHKYLVRCIVCMDYDPKLTPNASLAQVTAKAALLGQALRNEDWVLAYDLGNEPYFWELGQLRVADDALTTLHDKFPFDQHGNSSLSDYLAWLNPGFSSMFQHVSHGLPIPLQFEAAVNDVQGIYTAWIAAKQTGLQQSGDHHLTTVGYNTVWGLLECNKRLNFTNHHVYPNGQGYHTFSNFSEASYLPATVDRLKANWQYLNLSHPVTIGEFGTSDGDDVPCSSTVQHGCNLTLQETTTYDSLLWLKLLASDADGGNRWRMNDLPVPLEAQLNTWIGNISDPTTYLTYRQEAYFGLAADDGTSEGIIKPIGTWIRFFTHYLRDSFPRLPRVTLTTQLAPSNVRVGYSCSSSQAMFASGYAQQHLGSLNYSTFDPQGTASVAAFTMQDGRLAVMSTADTQVNISMDYFCRHPLETIASVDLLAGQVQHINC